VLTWSPCHIKLSCMPRKNVLVERARNVRARRALNVTDAEIELALAWMRSEVSMLQAGTVLGTSGGNVLYRMAVCLRAAYERGRLQEAA
jgi:hypothetical protein